MTSDKAVLQSNLITFTTAYHCRHWIELDAEDEIRNPPKASTYTNMASTYTGPALPVERTQAQIDFTAKFVDTMDEFNNDAIPYRTFRPGDFIYHFGAVRINITQENNRNADVVLRDLLLLVDVPDILNIAEVNITNHPQTVLFQFSYPTQLDTLQIFPAGLPAGSTFTTSIVKDADNVTVLGFMITIMHDGSPITGNINYISKGH